VAVVGLVEERVELAVLVALAAVVLVVTLQALGERLEL
jgi:Flp pilus assembly pilin Flp